MPPCTPRAEIFFYTQGEYVTMSNGIFNFNFLAFLLSEILGGSQFTLWGFAQVLAYIYIIVNFQLRSSVHAGLTERSLSTIGLH